MKKVLSVSFFTESRLAVISHFFFLFTLYFAKKKFFGTSYLLSQKVKFWIKKLVMALKKEDMIVILSCGLRCHKGGL